MMRRNSVSPSAFPGGRLLSLALVALVIFLPTVGCDTGSRAAQDDTGVPTPNPGPGPGGGRLTVPILFGISEGDSNLCVGQVITLTGINFSQTLANNRVLFRAGRVLTDAAPTSVAFPIDRNPADGLDSQLKVIIPTGVVTGSVELEVNGIFAGAIGYTACPMIYSFAIGPQRDQEILQHNGPLGFDPQLGPDTVVLQGVNFEEVTEVQIDDFQGNRQTISGANLQRRDIQPNNGLDTLLFSLRPVTVAVQQLSRDILRIRLRGGVLSNEVSVPVQPSTHLGEPIGPIVNGVILPTGVRTGPVRIIYSFYDRPVNMSYNMRFEWSADAGKTWFEAKHRDDDSLSDGTRQVLPGYRAFANPLPPADLILGGGALRTFTWDAQNDTNFRNLNNSPSSQGTAASRNWIVRFRMRAAPAFVTRNNDRFDPGILFETPSIAYFDVMDRPGESAESLRRSEFVENFSTENTKDPINTTALWGPPFNVGSLEGRLQDRPVPLFGQGTFDLLMSPFNPPPPNFVSEFYLIDTLRLRISQVAVVTTPAGNEQLAFQVFPTATVPNPGESQAEFHLRTLNIEPNITVTCEGTRPLVIKLSGRDLAPEDVVFQHDGAMQANGGPGGAAADPCMIPALPNMAQGGVGVLGGGDGGDGAQMTIGLVAGTPVVTGLLASAQGGHLGGGGGESPGVLDPDVSRASRFWGAPGGGGGHRLRGGTGDPGNPQPTVFNPPRGGRGGSIRGSEDLKLLTSGSGGGGGGATFARPNQTDPTQIVTSWGGGGGGGGGAILISANGSMMINGQIQANGGAGGSWVPPATPSPCPPQTPGVPSGPGGGGSGGAIYLQSSGLISVSCSNLEVNGGLHGEATAMNREPGSGDGAPGRIRVETRLGGGPFCSILALQTTLTARLSESTSPSLNISVADASQFPQSGVIVIDSEVIAYQSRTANAFQRLSRGQRGTTIASHEIGAAVVLDAVVEPPGSIVNGQPQVAAGEFPELAGLDDVLDLPFIASLDPETGDFRRDANGKILSIWTFNTDEGVVRDPRGAVVKVAIDATDSPGLLQLTRLRVGAGVTLRCFGSRPAEFLVVETADIAGTIDASGENGGILRFDVENPTSPDPGLGGAGGPGAGEGGTGATFIFNDGDVNNRTPANAEPIPARPGGLAPAIPPEWELGLVRFEDRELADDLADVRVTRATQGASLRDNACENQNNANNCSSTAGGGGGAGNQSAGQNGDSKPANATNGLGGSKVGTDSLRFDGREFLIGGSGGAGGGASLALSNAYVRKQAGPSLFQGEAHYAPGTGGGGGGGVIRLTVGGSLILRGTSGLVANGGNAFQSIDLGGNGGAGAGGTILIQALNSFAVEPGAKIQVRGGIANLKVPAATGQTLPVYEGNIRLNTATKLDEVFGGRGGNGAPGRVRIEVPEDSVVLQGGLNENLFAGLTLLDTEISAALSVPLRIGIGPARAFLSHNLEFTAPVLEFREFGQPIGTTAVLLWEGAPESIHEFGQVGIFSDGVLLPSSLYDTDYLRFLVILLSNNITREIPSVQRLRLPLELKP